VTIEGLDTCENLAVVSAGDQDLSARTDSGLEDGERTGGKLVLLNLSDFIFTRQQSVLTKSKHRGRDGLTSTLNGASKAALCSLLVLAQSSLGSWAHSESWRPPCWHRRVDSRVWARYATV
jgi:hypothetical protein